MLRLLVGLVLLPTSALTVLAAGKTIAALAVNVKSALPFTAGALAALALWLLGLAASNSPRGGARTALLAGRWIYVFGHELTHALAA
jgi:hypothetical protein